LEKMAAPITPNVADYSGHVITVFVDSTAAAGAVSVDLATYHPPIDLRIGHPVLSMATYGKETSAATDQMYSPADEMERAAAPTAGDEWSITDSNTIALWRGADKNFVLGITYWAYGGAKA
jgi:hypothetical protein